jgi:hypothetical protein
MSTLKILIIGILMAFSGAVNAQAKVNVNIGTPPQWGPSGHSGVRYYYLPDVESYYDVHTSRFIYYQRGKWVHRSQLPGNYRNYDLYSGYKVVMHDYNGNSPYSNHNSYKVKYHKGYKGPAQNSIGQNPGRANKNIKNSPKRSSNKVNQNINKSNDPGNVKSGSHGNQSQGGGKNSGGGKGGKGGKK